MRALIPVCDNYVHPWIERLMKENALRCPECGAAQSMLNLFSEDALISPRYVVTCGECNHCGEFGRNVVDAIKKWNKPPGFLTAFKKKWATRRLKKQEFVKSHKKAWWVR